jgi:hypothetical protein
MKQNVRLNLPEILQRRFKVLLVSVHDGSNLIGRIGNLIVRKI